MTLVDLSNNNYKYFKYFKDFMNKYFREGEDENTPQNIIDKHIEYMYSLVQNKEINARLAIENGEIIAMVMWFIDIEGHKYSRYPGYGNIFEIGVSPKSRNKGIGKLLVDYVEQDMKSRGVERIYIQAYGPSILFWNKMGYEKTEVLDKNGLYIYIKNI